MIKTNLVGKIVAMGLVRLFLAMTMRRGLFPAQCLTVHYVYAHAVLVSSYD